MKNIIKLIKSLNFYTLKKQGASVLIGLVISSLFSCHYLDIVPDNVATIEYAFRTRHTAEKYLFTCYSYIPSIQSPSHNPGWMAGDEFWIYYPEQPSFDAIGREVARGNQNVVDPYFDYWDGTRYGTPLYKGIRDCNTFLANIDLVPDLNSYERDRWIAEVKFLKAYYYFWLVKVYGPVVILDKNLPVDSKPENVKLYRQPVDSCFNYIFDLINAAIPDLPDQIDDRQTELGRITKVIALSMKAKIWVYAASPLFNGNPDYANFVDNKGTHLFSTKYDPVKWDSAVAACKAAIDICQSSGFKLHRFVPGVGQNMSYETMIKMSIRNSICDKWNEEIIWGNPNDMATGLQNEATPTGLDPSNPGNQSTRGNLAIPLKIVEMFYTNNGLPIDEDKTWDYNGRYDLKTVPATDKYNLQQGYTTAKLNFDRGLRFYADMGFDGATWYGQGRFDDENPWFVEAKAGQASTKITNNRWNITGYWPKKLVNFENVIGTGNSYTIKAYPWPIMRLADLYLLYAEALNESEAQPNPEVYQYLDIVRARAGLPSVEDAWTNNAKHPNKYKDKDGLREIIHRERLIEMAFESQRFWDLRRWKEALSELNNPIKGWHIAQEDAAAYYVPKVLFDQTFKKKDYFWPLKQYNLIVDKNLVQNPGW